MSRKKVAVIGGGIFGVTAALELSKTFSVDLYEMAGDLLSGATYANHNRHHYGFHYPRSTETVLQCQRGRVEFERVYKDALFWNFSNYYAVANDNSNTTFANYLKFCSEMNLSFEVVEPPENLFNIKKIEGCLLVKEGVYDYKILKKITIDNLNKNLNKNYLSIRLGSYISKLDSKGMNENYLYVDGSNAPVHYDFVINATYARSNEFCQWINCHKREFQFNLQELAVIKIPEINKIGLTVMDGLYPSLLPLGQSDEYLFAHAEESQLKREVSIASSGILSRVNYVESNWDEIKKVSAQYLPILERATYIRSIFVDRVVDSKKFGTDERVSENIDHGNGCWSVFSAKVLTSVDNAIDLHSKLINSL